MKSYSALAKKFLEDHAEECSVYDWSNDPHFKEWTQQFRGLLSLLGKENYQLGPEGQWLVLEDIESVIKKCKQAIMDDCSTAQKDAIFKLPLMR